jgi:hypothetical protein
MRENALSFWSCMEWIWYLQATIILISAFLMNGHYGEPVSLTPAMILDGGDGAYVKPGLTGSAQEGKVYAVGCPWVNGARCEPSSSRCSLY